MVDLGLGRFSVYLISFLTTTFSLVRYGRVRSSVPTEYTIVNETTRTQPEKDLQELVK